MSTQTQTLAGPASFVADAESREIAQRIDAELRRIQMTRRDLAGRINVNPGHVSRMLSGQRPLQVKHILRITDALDCPLTRIIPADSALLELLQRQLVDRQLPPIAGSTPASALTEQLPLTLAKPVAEMTAAERAQTRNQITHILAALDAAEA